MAAGHTPPGGSGKPRVLHCITRLGLGGAEAVSLSIVESLRDEFEFAIFAVRGVEPSVVGRAMQQRIDRIGLRLFCGPDVSQKFGGMILAGFAARRACRIFRPAAVHLHTEIPESAYATRCVLTRDNPPAAVVRTIHNCLYWHFWPRLGRWCERRLPRSHVACVSEEVRHVYRRFRDAAGAGPLPAEPVVIYNGVEPPARRAQPAGAPGQPVRILFAGRFELQKGVDLLPEALSRVQPPPDGGELVLHGQGSFAQRLRALAADPPAGWTVRVLPTVADLPKRMPDFDLFLLPSRFEGLALVAAEAALAGLPIVTTDGPGMREALPASHPWRARAGDAGSLAAALQLALNQRERWGEIAEQSRAFAAARFDPRRMTEDYRALYLRALHR